MTPGTILFDRNFKFKDGTRGEKYFIILNDGDDGVYIGVKTTSKGRLFGIQHGCQILDRYPNFHLVKNSCCLPKNTWVSLDQYFEFKKGRLLQEVLTNQIVSYGLLTKEVTKDLLVCVTHSEDISKSQECIVQSALKKLMVTS